MKTQMLSALFPLVLFWAIETYYGLKAALVAGCIGAVLEMSWEKYKTGRISFLTLSSNLLVLGLGAVSFWMDSGAAFKLQPAVMEIAMAVFMVGARIKGGEPFMIRTFRDSPMLDPDKRHQILAQPWFFARLKKADNRLILFFIGHGIAVAWAAIFATSTVWIALKGLLFYVMLVLVMLPSMRRPPV